MTDWPKENRLPRAGSNPRAATDGSRHSPVRVTLLNTMHVRLAVPEAGWLRDKKPCPHVSTYRGGGLRSHPRPRHRHLERRVHVKGLGCRQACPPALFMNTRGDTVKTRRCSRGFMNNAELGHRRLDVRISPRTDRLT